MLAFTLLLVVFTASHVGAVPLYGQCGGIGYEGPTFCDFGSECEAINEYYSQCVPVPVPVDPERPGPYEQCGGSGFTDETFCSGSSQCIFVNEFYSQCIPEDQLADLDEPCGPAADGKFCALRSRASGPVVMKCSSATDTDARCVLCGFRGLACCPAGFTSPDRPPCQAAPRFTPEIPCNFEEDICEGDIIRDY